MARHRSKRAQELPCLLQRLIHAAKHSGNDPDHTANHEVLERFGLLALITIPARGVFVATDNDVCMAIENIAKAHLGFEEARRELRKALDAVELFEKRDAIESAHLRVIDVSDQAYFYAGVAFGVTLSEFSG